MSRFSIDQKGSINLILFYRRFQSQKHWLSTTEITPFYTIRRYQKLAYMEARNYVAIPQLQWLTRYGTEFTFKGIPLSVTKFTEMFHGVYQEMVEIVDELTFGLSKDYVVKKVIDDPQELRPGYGFLVQETGEYWAIMQAILDDPKLKEKFCTVNGNKFKFHQKSNRDWLNKAARLKELFYIVIHCLCGMPKRGTEEWRLRVLNALYRQRNFMHIFGRVGIVGAYNKTSANKGVDTTTLHFLPKCFERLLCLYYDLIVIHEAYLVEHVLGITNHEYMCYFLSNNGCCWSHKHETSLLKAVTLEGVGTGLGKADLRHILPSIAEHYNIGLAQSGNAVLHAMLGHDEATGVRLYSQTKDTHQKLTNKFCHDTLDFCHGWAELLGFDSETPSLEKALSRQGLFEAQQGSWLIPRVELPNMQLADINEKLEELTRLVQALQTGFPANNSATTDSLYLHPLSKGRTSSSISSRSSFGLLQDTLPLTTSSQGSGPRSIHKRTADEAFLPNVEGLSKAAPSHISKPDLPQAGPSQPQTQQKSKEISFMYTDSKNGKSRRCHYKFHREAKFGNKYLCSTCNLSFDTEEKLVDHFAQLENKSKEDHAKSMPSSSRRK